MAAGEWEVAEDLRAPFYDPEAEICEPHEPGVPEPDDPMDQRIRRALTILDGTTGLEEPIDLGELRSPGTPRAPIGRAGRSWWYEAGTKG